MDDRNPALVMPPRQQTAEGEQRRVGVELEMNGIDLDQLSALVAAHGGYQIEQPGRCERRLTGDPAGDWIVELDSQWIKKVGRTARPEGDESAELLGSAEDALIWMAESLVPVELVSPPLPLGRLNEVNELIHQLRNAGAKGTGDRLTNAFGMQFNPEIPDADSRTLCAYLKAFLCLYDWLNERADVNLTRRITTYVDPFPADYVGLVTAPDYWPDQAGLIDDYLQHNPTRNRALDMLPLFAHIDEARVRAKVDDPRINARPTLHYRLPNSQIDNTQWALIHAWRDYLQVDALANDPDRLEEVCSAYRGYLDKTSNLLFGDWAEDVSRWLLPELL